MPNSSLNAAVPAGETTIYLVRKKFSNAERRKELAKEQIMAAVNGILAGQNEVLRVSFGQFIIQ